MLKETLMLIFWPEYKYKTKHWANLNIIQTNSVESAFTSTGIEWRCGIVEMIPSWPWSVKDIPEKCHMKVKRQER